MRLYGYDIRLVSYHTWLNQLEREADSGHPLRPLRSFFERPAGAGGMTLPELHARRDEPARARKHRSTAARCSMPLLHRYFSAFIAARHVPAPRIEHPHATASGGDVLRFDAGFSRALNRGAANVDVVDVQPLGEVLDHSIVSELTSWRSPVPTGLFRFAITIEGDGGRSVRRLVVKMTPADVDVIAVGEALAHLCDERIGTAYSRWSRRMGFVASHLREAALYTQVDPRYTNHASRSRPVLVRNAAASADRARRDCRRPLDRLREQTRGVDA